MDDETPPNLPTEEAATHSAFTSGEAGGTIGRYRLLQPLGVGGMGEVWLAEQQEPVRRKVALKVIKLGMDTAQVVARFEAERQALAVMDHPAVAKIYDAGSTERGRPYFVMEHVHGLPITEHCDRKQLTTRQRLELFIQVCHGVQHAHQKAIIHRDLKPSNVLVTVQDGEHVPKIIDFGVAKATAQKLTERTVFTELGVMIGTPEYMSPEQAEVSVEDVDTRTDVYSLGVLLYELLTGGLPFDSHELRSGGFDEIRRKIREDDPPRPSTRVSTIALGSHETADNRKTDAARLSGLLKGDLDWITMKALEKQRERRYASPNDLAADIERHLANQPVVAGPPGAVYRSRKFLRRHRIGVSVTAAAFVVLLSFAGMTAFQARSIASERDRANSVVAFLTELFEVSDPSEARGNEVTAREILDRGAERIERELADQPTLLSDMSNTIGTVYTGLGLYGDAERLLARALEVRRRVLGNTDALTLDSMHRLAFVYRQQSRFEEAESLLRETLEARRRRLGPDHVDTLETTNEMGLLLQAQGKYDEAEPYYREGLERRRRVLGDDHEDTIESILDTGFLLKAQGKYDEAEPYYREALQKSERVMGPDHPDTLSAVNNLGILLKAQGKHDEAETYLRRSLDLRRRVFGENHTKVFLAMNNLAELLKKTGRLDEAEPYYRKAHEGYRRTFGEEHRGTLILLNNLGLLRRDQGKLDEAEASFRKTLEIRRRTLGEEHPDTLNSLMSLSGVLRARGQLEEAERLTRQVVEGRRRALGEDHPASREARENLAQLLESQGKPAAP